MTKRESIIRAARQLVVDGWSPPVKPACSAFVAKVLDMAGVEYKTRNQYYVPELVSNMAETKNPMPGDLVVFKQTYDAVSPQGLGPEDDFTHIGILLQKTDAEWVFAHYSSTHDAPVTNVFAGYWAGKFQAFYSAVKDDEPHKVDLGRLKIFYNPGVKRPTIIIDGKEEKVEELALWIKTDAGTKLSINSQPFQESPALQIDDNYFPVLFWGKTGIKYNKERV